MENVLIVVAVVVAAAGIFLAIKRSKRSKADSQPGEPRPEDQAQ